jgi:3-phenylpropionate/trans-cinnamate dioxygenase ferredoxin reductase subunit
MSAAVDADVLIAGGGLAAQRCCEALRRGGFDGRIVVLCDEPRTPYDRPALSKAVLMGERDVSTLAYREPRWYEEHEIELLLGAAARELDATAHVVELEDGSRLRYGQLLTATGSRPRPLPLFGESERVHELRTAADAQALRDTLANGSGELAVIGAGLIGLEVASAARTLGRAVTVIEAAPTPLARALPPALGLWIARLHREHGVDVRLTTAVERVEHGSRDIRMKLSDGSYVTAETVLLAVGTVPATEWLKSSGLGPGAIGVDAGGRTRLPDVYAAGDAACYPGPHPEQRIPTQHWEAAARQGATVARSLLGQEPLPSPPSMFWSDQHGRRIQLVGHAPDGCHIELDGDPAASDFIAWLTHTELPPAAMLVNRPDALPQARARIAASHPNQPTTRRSR